MHALTLTAQLGLLALLPFQRWHSLARLPAAGLLSGDSS
jgi:hypothetical protein